MRPDASFVGASVTGAPPPKYVKPSILGSLMGMDQCALILAGVVGSGKTELLGRIITGLGGGSEKIGVAITEQTSGSPEVDLDRLPPGITDAVGIGACVCCAGNAEFILALNNLRGELGKSFFLIEQSGLTNAGDLRKSMLPLDFNPVIAAVVNPKQLSDPELRDDIVRHLLQADFIILTHVEDDPEIKARKELIQDILKEGSLDESSNKPIIEDNRTQQPLEAIWKAAKDAWKAGEEPLVQISTPQTAGGISLVGSGAFKAQRAESNRQQRARNRTELLVFPHPSITPETILKILQELRSGDAEHPAVKIDRAKGVIGGNDINITLEGGELKIDVTPRSTPSVLHNGEDFLIIGSTDPDMKNRLFEIQAKIGFEELPVKEDHYFTQIDRIINSYPSDEVLLQSVIDNGNIEVSFTADRTFLKLLALLPYYEQIQDRSSKDTFTDALITLGTKFLSLRGFLLRTLASDPAGNLGEKKHLPGISAGFDAARVLYMDTIKEMANTDDELREAYNDTKRQNPAKILLEGIANSQALALHGIEEISRGQIETFKVILPRALEDGSISTKLLAAAAAHIDNLISAAPMNEPLKTWSAVSRFMRSLNQ